MALGKGTKGPTGAGMQHTDRGPVQGIRLVGPSGEPIDARVDPSGDLRLLVDSNVHIGSAVVNVDLESDSDNVAIRNTANDNELLLESDGSITVRLKDESGVAYSNANPLPVEIATSIDLNIELDHTDGDSVQIGDGTDIMLVNDDGSINVTVNNASLAVTGTFFPGTQPVSGTFFQATQPVSATALDIRSLTHVSDSIRIGDGTDIALVTTAGELSVLDSNSAAALAALQATQTAVETLDDWDESDRAKVNPVVGQAGLAAGTGVDIANALRISLATNIPLPTGDNRIGQVKLTDDSNVAGITDDGELKVQADINAEDLANFTAYGEMEVANLKPVVNVSFSYTNHPDQVNTTLVGSGTVTNASGLAEIHSGAAITSSARLFTKDAIEFAPGQGVSARWTVFYDTGVAGNNQKVGAGDNTDGIFVGFSGVTFGIFLIIGGVPTFTAQTSFSEDVLDGTGPSGLTLDPTRGNIYQLQSTGSGIGHTILSIMDPTTRRFIPFHIINALNVATALNTATVIFPISAISENSTNTTDVVIRLGSLAGLIEGRGELSTIRRSVAVLRTGITTETAILTIRNKALFAGKTNLVRIQVDYMSTANDGNKAVTYRLVRDATIGGGPVFTDIDTAGSVIEFDSAGTTVTGGTEILAWELAKSDSDKFVVTSLFIVLRPGEQITVSAASTSSTETNIALGWRELF